MQARFKMPCRQLDLRYSYVYLLYLQFLLDLVIDMTAQRYCIASYAECMKQAGSDGLSLNSAFTYFCVHVLRNYCTPPAAAVGADQGSCHRFRPPLCQAADQNTTAGEGRTESKSCRGRCSTAAYTTSSSTTNTNKRSFSRTLTREGSSSSGIE